MYKNTTAQTLNVTSGSMTTSTNTSPASIGYVADSVLTLMGYYNGATRRGSYDGKTVAIVMINSASPLSSTVVGNIATLVNAL